MNNNKSNVRSSSAAIIIASSASLAVLAAAWRILLWRARTRAKETVARVRAYIKDDGPLVCAIVW